MIYLKTEQELVLMRRAGKVVADILDALRETVRAGVSTAELDRVAERHISLAGGTAAFRGYRPFHAAVPFPGVICASINEEIVHGIPSDTRILREGDIVSVDVGVCLEGYYGDAACTYPVGVVDASRQKLLQVTETALERALSIIKAG
ncbi:MAG: M24 family metallopeptidase, partial [Synergistaceae bacterium]|nr:M24 family metallopeptidase [Synergistaceae bacterium]